MSMAMARPWYPGTGRSSGPKGREFVTILNTTKGIATASLALASSLVLAAAGEFDPSFNRVGFTRELIGTWSARAELAHELGIGPVTDVGPEAGLLASFLFRAREEILVTSVRAGVFKSLDGGQSWVRGERGLVTPDGVEPYALSFCQSRSAPEIAYLITIMDGISRTADFGESFEPLVLPENSNLVECAVDPADPDVVYVLAVFDPLQPGFLFKSIDGGRSFFRIGAGLEILQNAVWMAIAPTNPLIVYIADRAASVGLYVSVDAGLTFRSLPNAPVSPRSVYPHPTEDGTLLLFALEGLFLSTDGGDSFARVGAGLPSGQPPPPLAFDTSDPSLLYAAVGIEGLFRSIDGGLTFERLSALGDPELVGRGVLAVGVSPGDAQNPPVLYAGTSRGPFRSDDGGATFLPIRNGSRATQVQDLTIDSAGRLLVATINSVGLFRSTGPGVYEIISDTLPNDTVITLGAVAAAPDHPDVYLVAGFVGTGGGILRTIDGGLSWSPALLPQLVTGSRIRIAFAPSDASRVYVVHSGRLLRSDDGGQSFQDFPLGSLGSVAVDPNDPDIVYVGSWMGSRGIYKSTDGGFTLEQLSVRGDFSAIVLDPERPEVIYAGSKVGRVIRSLDGGQTFASASVGLTGNGVLGMGIDPKLPTRLFVWMQAGGLFQSDDGADSWTAIETEETLRRSGAQSGQTALVIEPGTPTRVDLGWGSVLQFANPE